MPAVSANLGIDTEDPTPDSTGTPRKSPQAPDDPFAGLALISMLTISGLCLLFLLYRRAASVTYVVGNQLKTWNGTNEGRIRLSEDEGPSAQSFVVNDDVDSDDEDIVTPTPPSRSRSPMVPQPGGPAMA